MSASRLTQNHVFGVILDGYITHGQLRSGRSNDSVENVLPQGVKVNGGVLSVGQRHGAFLVQGDGGGQLGGLGQGNCGVSTGQADLIAVVFVVLQRGVDVGDFDPTTGLALKTVDRTPGGILDEAGLIILALAVILPLQTLGIHLIGIGHQGLTEDFLNLIFRGIARNDSGAILELRLGLHFGLHSGHIFGVLGGEGRQRHALGQHQGSQHAGHTLTEPLLFLHDFASSLSFHSFSDRYLRLKKGKIPSVFPEN